MTVYPGGWSREVYRGEGTTLPTLVVCTGRLPTYPPWYHQREACMRFVTTPTIGGGMYAPRCSSHPEEERLVDVQQDLTLRRRG